LSTILKNKNVIVDKIQSGSVNDKRKRLTNCVFPDIDEAMIKWVTTARQRNLHLSGDILKEKVKEFADALGHEEFLSSSGWLEKFKERHNVVQKAICGESAAVDLQTAEDWQVNILPNLIKE
jgi:hypothetical protein